MSETIYILTIVYFAFVVEDVQGKKIVALIKNVFHLDLSQLHQRYINLRDSLLNAINLKTASFA